MGMGGRSILGQRVREMANDYVVIFLSLSMSLPLSVREWYVVVEKLLITSEAIGKGEKIYSTSSR